MVSEEDRRENWVRFRCPRNCPFNDALGDRKDRFCSFSMYADILEPGRYTRTEVDKKGNVINYHVWPDCDVYPRYKGLNKVIREMKRRRQSEHKLGLQAEPDTYVTGHKHPAVSKHHGE